MDWVRGWECGRVSDKPPSARGDVQSSGEISGKEWFAWSLEWLENDWWVAQFFSRHAVMQTGKPKQVFWFMARLKMKRESWSSCISVTDSFGWDQFVREFLSDFSHPTFISDSGANWGLRASGMSVITKLERL